MTPSRNTSRKTPASTIRKYVYGILGILLVVGNIYAFWPFWMAARQLQTFCDALPAGASLADVQARADASGYVVDAPAGQPARVEDTQSFGRQSCDIQFDAQGRLQRR